MLQQPLRGGSPSLEQPELWALSRAVCLLLIQFEPCPVVPSERGVTILTVASESPWEHLWHTSPSLGPAITLPSPHGAPGGIQGSPRDASWVFQET